MNRSLLLSSLALCLVLVTGCSEFGRDIYASDDDDDDANTSVEDDCSNVFDDDNDGFVDCEDSDCINDPDCTGDDDDGAGGDDDTVGGDDDTVGGDDDSVPGTDDDGDGVTVQDGDCNDSDPTIYPGAAEVWDDGIDQDCDGIADVAGADCVASFIVDFPDGTSTTLNGCLEWSLVAALDYDPDEPPEVRSFTLNFGATTSEGFECEVTVVQDQVCGTGFYNVSDSAHTTTYALMDCSGVANEYEQTYTASTGYLRVDTLDTGLLAGNFTGQPLETTVQGFLSVGAASGVSGGSDPCCSGGTASSSSSCSDPTAASCVVNNFQEDCAWDWDYSFYDCSYYYQYYCGATCSSSTTASVGLSGNFSLTLEQVVTDEEQQTNCAVNSGDNDGDGVVSQSYGGPDCDDSDPYVGDIALDADCDGTLTAADCDDNDQFSTTLATDADCDGVTSSYDCDDSDPATVNDMDCDGVLTAADCDDNDATMPVGDSDCDGVLTAADCDDTDPAAGNTGTQVANDADCDGVVTAADCDDTDPAAGNTGTQVANDADCDGVVTAADCDDNNPLVTTCGSTTLFDNFDTGSTSSSVWTSVTGDADVTSSYSYSGSYSLHLGGGVGHATTVDINFQSCQLDWSFRLKRGPEQPDSGDYLYLEIENPSGWTIIDYFAGGTTDASFLLKSGTYSAPSTTGALRLRSYGSCSGCDDFFVDDFSIQCNTSGGSGGSDPCCDGTATVYGQCSNSTAASCVLNYEPGCASYWGYSGYYCPWYYENYCAATCP